MKMLETISKIERMDPLIRRKGTGTPETFARRLNISKRSLFRLIDLMKERGAPIYYCKKRESYCYERSVKFNFGFVLNSDDASEIKGGQGINFNNFEQVPNFGTARMLLCGSNY